METYGGSLFDITNSTFTNNNAVVSGGVMYMSESSFDVTNSTFNNSTAQYGGVIYTDTRYGRASFYIIDSTFNNSVAQFGGVMLTFDSSFNFVKTTFCSNS